MFGFQNPGQPLAASAFVPAQVNLWLYSPKVQGTQVIRPYVYSFTENTVDKLCNLPDLQMSLGTNGIFKDPDVAQAIKPEVNGIQLDMGTMSSLWTFVLQIDLPPGRNALGVSGVGSKIRVIAAGWVNTEPILPSSMNNAEPIVNKNAILYATHQTLIRIGEHASMSGGIPGRTIFGDNDLIGAHLASMARTDEPLLFCAPGDTIRNVEMTVTNSMGDPTSMVSFEGNAAVRNLENKPSAPIPTRLKSPRHHMQEIVSGLQSAISAQEMISDATSSDINGNSFLGNNAAEQAMRDFQGGLLTAAQATATIVGIDLSQPVSIGYLDTIYPNMLVQPFNIAPTSQWDVIPQTEISAKVQFSSMVASTVATLAVGVGLASVHFGYSTYVPSVAPTSAPSLFNVQMAFLLCPSPAPERANMELQSALNSLKRDLDLSLAPILKAAAGDFELSCRYDIGSETLVDLHFKDFTYSTEGRGWYESSNRLAGSSNPILGTSGVFRNNGAQLFELGTAITNRKLMGFATPPQFAIPDGGDCGVPSFGLPSQSKATQGGVVIDTGTPNGAPPQGIMI